PPPRLVSSLELLSRDRQASLLIIDPNTIMSREVVQKVVAWARSGRTVVMPRSTLFTGMARAELELLVAQSRKMDIDLGVRYRLHSIGDGRLIIHEMPAGAESQALSAWQTFLTAMLSLADIEGYCKVSDSRLSVIPLEKRGRELGLFVMNGTRRQVSGDLVFSGKVTVSDLAVAVSAATPPPGPVPLPHQAVRPPGANHSSLPANRFSLDVPPCGVLPLAVSGLTVVTEEQRERLSAALLSQATQDNATLAATTELPGFDGANPAIEDLWN
ncbi:MAG: hypothetical protein NDJ90_04210, partial [Oligoflexia bacterium]|nr:hypothetical protein [Oligoflexia bacterium]